MMDADQIEIPPRSVSISLKSHDYHGDCRVKTGFYSIQTYSTVKRHFEMKEEPGPGEEPAVWSGTCSLDPTEKGRHWSTGWTVPAPS